MIEFSDEMKEAIIGFCEAYEIEFGEFVKSLEIAVGSVNECISKLSELFSKEAERFEFDTPTELKKRIKYCKNPMEKQMLQKKLNEAYKKNNRRKRK